MPKTAIVVTVSVHVKLAGEPRICGISTSSTLTHVDYEELRVGETGIKRYRAALAGMLFRKAENDMRKLPALVEA